MADESFITFNLFEQFNEITCAFSTRKGGYSADPFSSQNMGNIKYDNPSDVARNRLNFYHKLDIDPSLVILPGQTHSANVRIARKGRSFANTDALISNKPNIFLGIQTADCFPVFLFEPDHQVICLIHAGWRGAVGGIIPKSIDMMISKFNIDPLRVFAIIGPGLQKECFEVRRDVFNQFSKTYLHNHTDNSKMYLDLQAYIIDCLVDTGIEKQNIEMNNTCTKCSASLFYSYRRDGVKSGRMMGLLGIRHQR